MMASRGNPNPNQDGLLRAQLERRDAQIDRQANQLRIHREVAEAAKHLHEKLCDCDGEACALGLALRRLREATPPKVRSSNFAGRAW